MSTRFGWSAALLVATMASLAQAQQVNIRTPFHTINDGFYENIGMNWGFNGMRPDGSGFFFNGPGAALPPFGNHDPNSDARFGFGTAGPNGRGFFNFTFGQGNSRSMTMNSPNVTVPNGYGGSVSDTRQRPFVTGFTPIIGFRPPPPPVFVSPLGASREEIYRNVSQVRAKQLQDRADQRREEEKEDARALADERTRLRNLGNKTEKGDDPPLRLIGQ